MMKNIYKTYSFNLFKSIKSILSVFLLIFLLACPQYVFASKTLTVSAAASLTDAFKAIVNAFEKSYPNTHIDLNLASSGTLCAQIERGAPVDVYASASERFMNRLQKEKMIINSTRHDFARNSIVVIQGKNVPKIHKLSQLLDKTIAHIAIGDPSHVPAGRYAKEALIHAGLWKKLQNKLVLGVTVRQVREYVAQGAVEAGIVFSSDALVPQVQVVIKIPSSYHSPICYPIAVVKGCKNIKLAREFISFVLSPEGQKILKRYGFRPIKD